MKTFREFIKEGRGNSLNSKTHSIIDGLNRGKNAEMKGKSSIPAKIINQDDLKPLTPDEAAEHDRIAGEARKKGDYFTGSTFGNEKNRYSVAQAIAHAATKKTLNIPTKGFVRDQVRNYWQGNVDRAKKAIPSRQAPILIMKHSKKQKSSE